MRNKYSLSADNLHTITDHLFRHEAGKMVSILTKIFGTENLETSEDVVQQTFFDAIRIWKIKGIPDNPSAWLFHVARNKAIDVIRKNKYSVQYDFSDSERALLKSEYTLAATMENMWKEELVNDDMLRMMFACCHADISVDNQITLILKTLCGFSTAEIARAFLTSEETVSKRLYRTKEFFRQRKIKPEVPSAGELVRRTDAVLNTIYLLFNEGYNSSASDELIRKDLMSEAMLLCKLLTENKNTQLPQTFALMALMYFHASRTDSRLSPEGEIILLPHQDRSKWNMQLITQGNEYLNIAAFGNEISAYHIEAAIAYEHCTAKSFANTNWPRVLELYEWLGAVLPSPIVEMNKTVAIMQVHGAGKALEALLAITDRKKLESFYIYHCLLGEINSRLQRQAESKSNFETAMMLTNSATEKKMLREKIIALLN